jgi:hypothetical protein
MSQLVHHNQWSGYATVATILAAAAIFVWMFLRDSARILTNWQTGRW